SSGSRTKDEEGSVPFAILILTSSDEPPCMMGVNTNTTSSVILGHRQYSINEILAMSGVQQVAPHSDLMPAMIIAEPASSKNSSSSSSIKHRASHQHPNKHPQAAMGYVQAQPTHFQPQVTIMGTNGQEKNRTKASQMQNANTNKNHIKYYRRESVTSVGERKQG
ncbi:unnamed protein product, partial [Meganyctiphanes norvegica]